VKKAATRSAPRTPTIDLQVTGVDGVVYRIPAAELGQYAVPTAQAFRIASGGSNECTVMAELTMPGGPSGGMSAMPPSMLARLVRVAVELGIEEPLEQALRGSNHEFSLPTTAVRELIQSSGSRRGADGLEAGDGPFTRMTLLSLGRTIAAAVRAGGFDKALRVMRPLDAQFKITLTSATSRNVKLVIHDASRETEMNRSQSSVARVLRFSECSCNPPSPKPPPPPPNPNCVETSDTGMMGCPQ